MVKLHWNTCHSNLITDLFNVFNDNEIDFIIPRNYEGLPLVNTSKDVDIIVDPAKVKDAVALVKKVYKQHGFKYYYQESYATLTCCFAVNKEKEISIHIDVIGSYVSKGYEIYSFEDLLAKTNKFENIRVFKDGFRELFLFFNKTFNYNIDLKKKYIEEIKNSIEVSSIFKDELSIIVGEDLAVRVCSAIQSYNVIELNDLYPEVDGAIKRYVYNKCSLSTFKKITLFNIERLFKVGIRYRKFERTISVMAPDGAGKTTFLNSFSTKLASYNCRDKTDDVATYFHFRPTIFPNLSEIGEKAKVMKRDIDYSNPHRAKPANVISSFIRMIYYSLDYILGFNYFVRRDVQYGKFTIFDRYAFDMLVDPKRSRLNLPLWLRKVILLFIPKPKLNFYLEAPPEVIFERKQELTLEEIKRQQNIFDHVAEIYGVVKIDSSKPVDELVDEAIAYVLDLYYIKL